MYLFKIILISLFFILGLVTSIVLMPEGRVVEYRIDTYNGTESILTCPRIDVIVENGRDNVILLPGYSMEEAINMMDSLNQSIK